MDWDDLRYFLSILRSGGITRAAKRLGVTASTLYRRLDSLEESLGVRLIERGGRGVTLTAAGEELLRTAEEMDRSAEAMLNSLAGRDLEPAGSVRITAPDDLSEIVLFPILKAFQQRHPKITVELINDNRFLNLTRREADIALRPTRQPPENLLGRRLARVAAAGYIAADLPDAPFDRLQWLAWDEGLGPEVTQRWLQENVGPERVRLRLNSMRSLAEAAGQGLGAAFLPCRIGDADPRLKRVVEPREDWSVDLWLLTHPGLRSVARIRLVSDAIFEALRTQRAAFAGEAA